LNLKNVGRHHSTILFLTTHITLNVSHQISTNSIQIIASNLLFCTSLYEEFCNENVRLILKCFIVKNHVKNRNK